MCFCCCCGFWKNCSNFLGTKWRQMRRKGWIQNFFLQEIVFCVFGWVKKKKKKILWKVSLSSFQLKKVTIENVKFTFSLHCSLLSSFQFYWGLFFVKRSSWRKKIWNWKIFSSHFEIKFLRTFNHRVTFTSRLFHSLTN